VDEAWSNVLRQVRPARRIVSFRRMAAAAVLLVGIMAGGYRWWMQTRWVHVATERERREVLLPDGSSVWLNFNTKLAYRETFRSSRDVRLSGEAYFEVVKNSDAPFSIEMSDARVEVLGTSFNLSSYAPDSSVDLKVTSGKVAFASKEGKASESRIVLKGQSASLRKNSGEIVKAQGEDRNALAWKTRRLHFENSGIGEIGKVFFHVYGSQLVIDKRFEGRTVNVNFVRQSKKEVAEVIASLLGGSLQVQGDIFVIM
ncbi:MAG: FecR domain-containing protein, partial [Cytophagales bacterium]|nr:FecR domain-containing protein [Cytophagales bacterium]